jgi:uncharacterized protein
MLVIPAHIGNSSLEGLGVFTRDAIRAGQVVSQFRPPLDVMVTREFVAALSEPEREYLHHFAYLSMFLHVYILTGDHDRYMNHSGEPNVGIAEERTTDSVALRDIAAGEELTCDYRTFDAEWRRKLPFLCS